MFIVLRWGGLRGQFGSQVQLVVKVTNRHCNGATDGRLIPHVPLRRLRLPAAPPASAIGPPIRRLCPVFGEIRFHKEKYDPVHSSDATSKGQIVGASWWRPLNRVLSNAYASGHMPLNR